MLHVHVVPVKMTGAGMTGAGPSNEQLRDERRFLVLVVAYPAETVMVADIRRKSLEKIATFP